jgi:hypothetical protein
LLNKKIRNTIEINGKQYLPIEREEKKKKSFLNGKMGLMLMAYGMVGAGMCGSSRTVERPQVDIVKEFGLIEQKKSQLTRSQRDWVCQQFRRNFKEVTEPLVDHI